MRTHVHNTPQQLWDAIAANNPSDTWVNFKADDDIGTGVAFFKPKAHDRHVINFVHFAGSKAEYQAIDAVAEPTNNGESVKHVRVEVPQPVIVVYDLTIYSPLNLPNE